MNHINYYYKGYDISNKNNLERISMEIANPYGYNFNRPTRRIIDRDCKVTKINQDFVKNKEFNSKKA